MTRTEMTKPDDVTESGWQMLLKIWDMCGMPQSVEDVYEWDGLLNISEFEDVYVRIDDLYMEYHLGHQIRTGKRKLRFWRRSNAQVLRHLRKAEYLETVCKFYDDGGQSEPLFVCLAGKSIEALQAAGMITVKRKGGRKSKGAKMRQKITEAAQALAGKSIEELQEAGLKIRAG